MRAAVQRIIERREQAEDPNVEQLSDDPESLLSYLEQHPNGDLDPDTHEAELLDAQLIVIWLYWRWLHHDMWVLAQGERFRLNRRKMGSALNLSTGQAIVDRIRLARAALRRRALGYEDLSTDKGSADIGTTTKKQPDAPELRTHEHLLEVVNVFRQYAPDETLEWLSGIDSRTKLAPGVISAIELAAGELADYVEDQGFSPDHDLIHALKMWDCYRPSR